MPNFCSNQIRIAGPSAEVDQLVELLKSPTGESDFDFGQIVPLPYLEGIASDGMGGPLIALLSSEPALREEAVQLAGRAKVLPPAGTHIPLSGSRWPVALDPGLLADCASFVERLYQTARERKMDLDFGKLETYLPSQGLTVSQSNVGIATFEELCGSGVIYSGNMGIGEIAGPLWGGRGPLGEVPVETFEAREDKAGRSAVTYFLYTAWSPAVPLIRVLAAKYPALEVDHAYSIEGNPEVGVYQYRRGAEECLFDGDFYDELRRAAPAITASPFDLCAESNAYISLSKEMHATLEAGKTLSLPHFLDNLSIGTGEDADIQLDGVPSRDDEDQCEVSCSYEGVSFELIFEFESA